MTSAVTAAVVVLLFARTSHAAQVTGTVVDGIKVGIAKAAVSCEDAHNGTYQETSRSNGSFLIDTPTDSHYLTCAFRAAGYISTRLKLKRIDSRFTAGLVVLQPVIELKGPVRVSTHEKSYLVDAILMNKSADDVVLSALSLTFEVPKERSCMTAFPDVVLWLEDKADLATSRTMTGDVPFSPLPPIVSISTTYKLEYNPCIGGVARVPVPHMITLAAAGKDGDTIRIGIFGPRRGKYQDDAGGSRVLSISEGTSGQALTLRVTLDNASFVTIGTAPASVELGPL